VPEARDEEEEEEEEEGEMPTAVISERDAERVKRWVRVTGEKAGGEGDLCVWWW
jgi:hypothetical protein